MFSFLNPVGNYLREIKEPTKSSDFLVNHAKRPCIHHFANRSEPGTPRISSPSQYLLTVSRIERDKSAFRRDNFKLPPLKRRLHRELIYYFGNDPKFELDRHDRKQKKTRMLVPAKDCSNEACRQMYQSSTSKPRHRILKKRVTLERAVTLTY